MMLNKKGDEKYFSIWWILALAVIAVGIVAGVYIFYSSSTDMRGVEAKVLYERISDCLVNEGYLNERVLDSDFDIFKECNLKKTALSDTFYFNISFSGLRSDIVFGNLEYQKDCEVSSDKTANDFPQCISITEPFLIKDKTSFKMAILTASNNDGRKIPGLP